MLSRAVGFSAGLHAAVLVGLCGSGWLPAAGPGAPPSYGALRWAPEAGPPVILEAPRGEMPLSLGGFLPEPDVEEVQPLPAMEGFPFPAPEPLPAGRIPQAADATDGGRPPRPSQPRHGGRGENEAGSGSGAVGADPWPCPPPPYPADAVSRGIAGVLEVEVQVLPDGKVGRVRLLRSSGSPVLDRCVLAWIPARWGPFQPMKNEAGVPLAYTFTRPVRFSLSGR